jgi:hypothetical protein
MKQSIRRTFCILAAAALGCIAPSMARATTITAQLTGLSPYVFGHINLAGAGSLYGGVGTIEWQGVSTNVVPFNGPYGTYCIDLIQDIGIGNTYSYTIGTLSSSPKAGAYPSGTPTTGMGVAKADEIEELYGQQLPQTLGGGSSADLASQAFQLAIWNIVYDTDLSVTSGAGSFSAGGDVDPNAITLANTYLVDAANTGNQAKYDSTYKLVALIGLDGAQDQVAVDPNITFTGGQAPLPPSALGGGVLLACLAASRLRRHYLLRDAQ